MSSRTAPTQAEGLYIAMLSVHGLVRGENPELGRDADTGGQVKYVVEAARALAEHPAVERVDLLTRLVKDSRVAADYAVAEEEIAPGARIFRLPCGPARYLRKEVLWPHLDSFVDQALRHIHRAGRIPDLVHTHYADAGYIGCALSALLGVPLAHTGHSLGRVKRQRLIAQGLDPAAIDSRYNFGLRIEAEEAVLDSAGFVVASTRQEVEEQYGLYDHYEPERMVVIPPGVDLRLFHPPGREKERPAIQDAIDRFLREPDKPMILAMARPDPRKNLAALIQAYAEDPALREKANLAIIAGNRDEIASMEKVSREVLTEILLLVDKYDLYGKVAYPKRHEPDDVPHIYRLAARRRGVFVNPALTEPFGLTLIEAAASGLPLVATNDGGPRDILAQLQCGVLVDALSVEEIRGALRRALEDPLQWKEWSRRGARYAPRLYGWKTHVANYLKAVEKNLGHRRRHRRFSPRSRLPTIDRMLICDIDNTLIGDRGALRDLLEVIRSTPALGFGVATGRHLELTLDVLDEWDVPVPDVLITSVGTEIHYGEKLARDGGWSRRIDYRWNPAAICDVLRGVPGLVLQPEEMQRRFKISYFCDPRKAPSIRSLARDLRHRDLPVKLVYSHGQFLDVLPVRASKGLAVRFFAMRWGLEPDHILVCGDSGNDVEMLSGETLGVVVGNYSKELERLRGRERIYFAGAPYARGILEGMEYYDFLGEIRAPEVVEFTA